VQAGKKSKKPSDENGIDSTSETIINDNKKGKK